ILGGLGRRREGYSLPIDDGGAAGVCQPRRPGNPAGVHKGRNSCAHRGPCALFGTTMRQSNDWAAGRQRVIPDPTVPMLNPGSFGPLPRPVFDRATELRLRLAAGPTDFFVRQAPPLLWQSREATAAFLGTSPRRLVFTANVSAAINLVASGLRLASPGEILMTDHEYGAMVWCWERAGQRQGLSVRTFPVPTMANDPGEIVEAAARAITPRTRVLFFSHVLSPTGLVLPAKQLCAEARKRGVLSVVDGAHAPAMIPLSVNDVAADFYTGNLHQL